MTTTPALFSAPTPAPTLVEAVNGLLYSAANVLSTLPQGPITHVLEGGLWVVRRVLFPASVGVIVTPVDVPLYLTSIDSNGDGIKDDQKLGIYASLGLGSPPQLFEFDTGAAGFFAAYASDNPSLSYWWGNGVQNSTTEVTRSDDSGVSYKGHAASTSVSLFALGSSTPLLSTANVLVGQADKITKDGTTTWDANGVSGGITPPPVEDAFYGDFGVGTNYESNDITSLLAQLSFGGGVSPGFIVHVDKDSGAAWVQVGLSSKDLTDTDTRFFTMIQDKEARNKTAPYSGVQFYRQQLIAATVNVERDGKALVSNGTVPIVVDTGAHTTLHNTDKSSSADVYDSIVDWTDTDHKKGVLDSGLKFFLSGVTTDGRIADFFDLHTDSEDIRVRNEKSDGAVGSNKDEYFLNSGIELFYKNDVVYSLGTSAGGGALGVRSR